MRTVEYDPAVAEIVSVDEAARVLGLSRTTIFKFMREGKLARYRREGDRRTLVDQEELARLVEPRRVDGSP